MKLCVCACVYICVTLARDMYHETSVHILHGQSHAVAHMATDRNVVLL